MTDFTTAALERTPLLPPNPVDAAAARPSCDECLGSGGWFRYEPSLEPAPGLLYLSCLQCRGSGLRDPARA